MADSDREGVCGRIGNILLTVGFFSVLRFIVDNIVKCSLPGSYWNKTEQYEGNIEEHHWTVHRNDLYLKNIGRQQSLPGR